MSPSGSQVRSNGNTLGEGGGSIGDGTIGLSVALTAAPWLLLFLANVHALPQCRAISQAMYGAGGSGVYYAPSGSTATSVRSRGSIDGDRADTAPYGFTGVWRLDRYGALCVPLRIP
jgi:hypothetical protein